MAAEAVSSRDFQVAFLALPRRVRVEIDQAIRAIEADPGWYPPFRYLAPGDSPYSGFIADISVRGWVIIYRIADHGATIELWYLYEVPTQHRPPRPPAPGMPPAM